MSAASKQAIDTIYADAKGETHFGQMTMEIKDAGNIGFLAQTIKATGIIFRQTPADYDYAWHPTPNKQFVVICKGQVDFSVTTDNETRRYGPGDVVLLDDKGSKGHYAKAVDGVRDSIFVTLD